MREEERYGSGGAGTAVVIKASDYSMRVEDGGGRWRTVEDGGEKRSRKPTALGSLQSSVEMKC
jgi:hypothetical protein